MATTSASARTSRIICVSRRKWRVCGETRMSGHGEAFTLWLEWASSALITRLCSKWELVRRIAKYCQCVWGVRPMHKATSEIRRTRSFPRLNSLPKDFVQCPVCWNQLFACYYTQNTHLFDVFLIWPLLIGTFWDKTSPNSDLWLSSHQYSPH